jgi:hypothetical protein
MLAGAVERLRNSYAGRQLPLDERVSGRYLAVAEDLLGPRSGPERGPRDGNYNWTLRSSSRWTKNPQSHSSA